jgi:hypothetical protein
MKLILHSLLALSFVACSKSSDSPQPAASAKPPSGAPAAAETVPSTGGAAATGSGAVAGSCMNATKSQCTTYTDASLAPDAAKSLCDAISGTFTASAACPTDKQLGQCQLAKLRKHVTYYPGGDDGLTAAYAKEDCGSSGGVWAM